MTAMKETEEGTVGTRLLGCNARQKGTQGQKGKERERNAFRFPLSFRFVLCVLLCTLVQTHQRSSRVDLTRVEKWIGLTQGDFF